jgi:hypothetical protein
LCSTTKIALSAFIAAFPFIILVMYSLVIVHTFPSFLQLFIYLMYPVKCPKLVKDIRILYTTQNNCLLIGHLIAIHVRYWISIRNRKILNFNVENMCNGFSSVSRQFSPRRPGFDPTSGQVEFVVDKVARCSLTQSISVSPTDSHSTYYFKLSCHPGSGTIGPLVAGVPSRLSLTPPHE